MSNKIFVDTLFLVALINRRDQYHQQARELADRFNGYPLLTTDAILLEFGNALARNYKNEAADLIEYFLSAEEAEIFRLTHELFDKAFDLYKSYQDQSWGLVDCISFVVMREANVTQALTCDRHFIQAGFQTLMV